jgi:hypothetical protein
MATERRGLMALEDRLFDCGVTYLAGRLLHRSLAAPEVR